MSPTVLELIPLERGLIAFRGGAIFLSAIPDGSVRLSPPWCSTWELFLASEDWCSDALATDNALISAESQASFNKKGIASYIVHPLTRISANTKPKAKKVLIYGYTKWSHGRVYYDLCKHLHQRGYIVDILDWQVNHASYISQIISYYDLFISALDGVRTLADVYRVPYNKIIALSHHEFDIRMLIEQKGIEVFDQFASYGVVSESLYCASLMQGVTRIPTVASLATNYLEFRADVPERLTTVGYASSMSTETYGVEWKRGNLAEAAAREAGLAFKVAGWTGNQISFHDMPDFYRSVDAVIISSISESGPLPVMEAAAAGRLVIGTPVGHFPRKAYEGGGIIAPVEEEKFKAFTAATLRYYKGNPKAYVEKCRAIQEAAKKFDWQYSIAEWAELIEGAAARSEPRTTADAMLNSSGAAGLNGSQLGTANAAVIGPTISIIVPSRLARTAGDGQRLFLEDAIRAIRQQQNTQARFQIIVGVDAGAAASVELARRLDIEFAESKGHSQAAALNAASERAVGEFIAILEDDDAWDRMFLCTALDALGKAEFVSSNELQVNASGQVVEINDFPCPSGWIMRRDTFKAVGGFDETYRWHLDNEWLGRLGETGRSRIHFVESTAPIEPELLAQRRLGLHNALRFGGPAIQLKRHPYPAPLVIRRVHDGSGMASIVRDAERIAESDREFERLRQRFGYIPW